MCESQALPWLPGITVMTLMAIASFISAGMASRRPRCSGSQFALRKGFCASPRPSALSASAIASMQSAIGNSRRTSAALMTSKSILASSHFAGGKHPALSVLQRLGDVFDRDGVAAREVGDGAAPASARGDRPARPGASPH